MLNEWKFSCIADDATLSTEIYPQNLPTDKKNSLSFVFKFSNSTSWKLLQLFFIYNVSPCPVKAEQWARGLEMFFSENHLRLNWKGKKKTVSCFTSYREEFHHMWSSRAKWKLFLVFRGGSSRKNPAQSFPPNSEPTLVGLEHGRQTNWPEADSCVNKALSGYWKLANLHKVCLREGRKRRICWKEEGGIEV